jgi:hypothetical protein
MRFYDPWGHPSRTRRHPHAATPPHYSYTTRQPRSAPTRAPGAKANAWTSNSPSTHSLRQ